MSRRKGQKDKDGISRREFARKAMLTATAAALPSAMLAQNAAGAEPAQAPNLPATAQAEAERAYAAVLARYGTRLTEAQKSDLRNILGQQQKSIDTLRAFSLDNGVQPATVLRPRTGRS